MFQLYFNINVICNTDGDVGLNSANGSTASCTIMFSVEWLLHKLCAILPVILYKLHSSTTEKL